jgi:hypothetical protein
MTNPEQKTIVIETSKDPRNWMPEGHPRMRLSEEFQRKSEEWLVGIGYPYPRVEVVVDDPNYDGPITRVASLAVDPGGGNYPYCLDSFVIWGKGSQPLAQVYGSSKSIFVKDNRLSKKDIADAIEGLRNALGMEWDSITGHSDYLIRGGLYKPLTDEEITSKAVPDSQIVMTEVAKQDGSTEIVPVRFKNERTWVIEGEFNYY